MFIRCPICNMVVKGTNNMALHLTGHGKFSAKHESFLNSYILVKEGVVALKGRIGNSNYQPIMQLIEKECTLTE